MSGVTNGALQGTNGRARNPLRQAYAAGAALLLAAILVNIGSHLHEQPGLPAWKPITWETTSFAGCLAGMWIVFGAVRVIGARRHPLPVSLALHWAAATIFSAVHCLIMWSLRRLVFTLAGAPYGWHMPLGQALYEYRKDLITYIILAGLYWGLCRLAETRAPPPSMPRPAPFGAPSFDIRDGTNLLRVPVADIVAAESAGEKNSCAPRSARPRPSGPRTASCVCTEAGWSSQVSSAKSTAPSPATTGWPCTAASPCPCRAATSRRRKPC
jgi:hypothetical protein